MKTAISTASKKLIYIKQGFQKVEKGEFNFSYSSLNRLIFSPSLFYKDYILKDKDGFLITQDEGEVYLSVGETDIIRSSSFKFSLGKGAIIFTLFITVGILLYSLLTVLFTLIVGTNYLFSS